MKKVGTAVALKDYKYIQATGTGGKEVKIVKGKEYDIVETGGKVRVSVPRKNSENVLVPSFHKERYTYNMFKE